jgi:hypothetical protein
VFKCPELLDWIWAILVLLTNIWHFELVSYKFSIRATILCYSTRKRRRAWLILWNFKNAVSMKVLSFLVMGRVYIFEE